MYQQVKTKVIIIKLSIGFREEIRFKAIEHILCKLINITDNSSKNKMVAQITFKRIF